MNIFHLFATFVFFIVFHSFPAWTSLPFFIFYKHLGSLVQIFYLTSLCPVWELRTHLWVEDRAFCVLSIIFSGLTKTWWAEGRARLREGLVPELCPHFQSCIKHFMELNPWSQRMAPFLRDSPSGLWSAHFCVSLWHVHSFTPLPGSALSCTSHFTCLPLLLPPHPLVRGESPLSFLLARILLRISESGLFSHMASRKWGGIRDLAMSHGCSWLQKLRFLKYSHVPFLV